mgnify:CR=1 FL=1
MFTHRLAVSNQPRLAEQLPHLGLHHVMCIICHYDIYICGKRLELMLAPAPHGCCILHMVRCVLCTSASANSACCIQSCTLFAFRKYGCCIRTPCPHIIHLSAPHPHMILHMIHFPQLPPYISLLILTLFIVFHHLFVFSTHLLISNTVQHTL